MGRQTHPVSTQNCKRAVYTKQSQPHAWIARRVASRSRPQQGVHPARARKYDTAHSLSPVHAITENMTHTSQRQCGPCTSCCEGWLTGNIRGHAMEPGTACHFLREKQCSIYLDRPEQPCRQFECGWLLHGSPFAEDDRPDKLGVIIVPILWRGRRAWILVPAGRDPDEALMTRMRQHSQSTGEPHMIKKPGRLLCYGAPEFQQDMIELAQQGKNPW